MQYSLKLAIVDGAVFDTHFSEEIYRKMHFYF